MLHLLTDTLHLPCCLYSTRSEEEALPSSHIPSFIRVTSITSALRWQKMKHKKWAQSTCQQNLKVYYLSDFVDLHVSWSLEQVLSYILSQSVLWIQKRVVYHSTHSEYLCWILTKYAKCMSCHITEFVCVYQLLIPIVTYETSRPIKLHWNLIDASFYDFYLAN